MRPIDGLELVRRTRALSPDRPARAIALTGQSSGRQVDELPVPFDAHLVKPVEPQQLLYAVLYALQRPSVGDVDGTRNEPSGRPSTTPQGEA
jgi:CheY-like chemotaxis protein